MSWWSRLWGWTGFKDKTLWDWLKLLVVPLTLAALTIGFSFIQARNQNAIEESRAAAQASLQGTTEADRANASALQAYYDKMAELLLERNLRNSEYGTEVRSIATAMTLATLRGLDGERKGSLLQFLYESELISKENVIINLSGADLSGASLSGAYLRLIWLNRTFLSGADLGATNLLGASLRGADLSGAKLRGSNLRWAYLRGASLRGADLRDADLRDADLLGADLSGTINLNAADLTGAKYASDLTQWPEGFDPNEAGAILEEEE